MTSRYPVPGTEDLLVRLDLPPLTPAEQRRLHLRLPALHGLDPAERELVSRTLGGHPRLLEFLDVLLRHRPDPTTTLRHVTAKLRGLADAEGIDPRPGRGLDQGVTDALRLGSRDILLTELLDRLTPAQRELALVLSVLRAPVTRDDLAQVCFHPDPASAEFDHTPDPTAEQLAALDADLERLRELTLIPVTSPEFAMHPWVAAALERHHTPDDFAVRHRRGIVIRGNRTRSGRGGIADEVEFIRHCVATGNESSAAFSAITIADSLTGAATLAAFLAEVVALIPVTEDDYLHLAHREVRALRAVGLAAATADKVHHLHAVAAARADAEPSAENLDWLRASHEALADLAVARGDSATAERHLSTALRIAEGLVAAEPANPAARHRLGVVHNELGIVVAGRGDGVAAERHHTTALRVARGLVEDDPGDDTHLHLLSTSHGRLAALATAKGDTDAARLHLAADLDIAERLAAEHPDNVHYRRDLGVSHNAIARTAHARGDLDTAHRHYAIGLRIAETLLDADPDNAGLRRDVCVGHEGLGGVAMARGDTATAERHFSATLRADEHLLAADSGNAFALRDVSVSHNKLGEVAMSRGDGASAHRHFIAALAIRERLAAADPAGTQVHRDVASSHQRAGDLAMACGEAAAAGEHYGAALKITERLSAADPGNVDHLADLYRTQSRIGSLPASGGDIPEAREFCAVALRTAERLLAADQGNRALHDDIAALRSQLAGLRPKRKWGLGRRT